MSAERPIVWSIAGSDSGGGAGLQADLRAFAAFGVHGCSAVAALTAQNSVAVMRIEAVSEAMLDAQLAALAADLPPAAIKTGMLGSVANLQVVVRWIDRLRASNSRLAVVVDPVLGATTGARFADEALLRGYQEQLLPRATLITPNRVEAEALGVGPTKAPDTVIPAKAGTQGFPTKAGKPWVPASAGMTPGGSTFSGRTVGGNTSAGVTAGDDASLVITGGDAASDFALDWMHTPQATGWLRLPRVPTAHHHGTGCTFAASAAAALALGYATAEAVVLAKMATTQALREAYPAGRGAGPVHPSPQFAASIDNLPHLVDTPAAGPLTFSALKDPDLGLYAVVDSAAWVERVLAAGVRTVQLRIKDPASPHLRAEIRRAAAACERSHAQLFVNDHWQLALEERAYGVHLGQEDLAKADLRAIAAGGLRLGVSTHAYWEVCRAWALRPSYIACGPIHRTAAKEMPWIPQGNGNLAYWAKLLPVPIVAIAGMDPARAREARACGAAGVAVMTGITGAADPEGVLAAYREALRDTPIGGAPVPPRARPTL